MFRAAKLRSAAILRRRLEVARLKSRPPEPLPPKYTPMYAWKELPSDYSKDFKPEVWRQMRKNPLPTAPSPWINPDSLMSVAEKMEFPDLKEVAEVASILREGADTGVTGAARLPQQARNSPKVFEYGDRVLDTLRSWLEKVSS